MTNEKTTVFTGTTLERHSNRIKAEALNEVIEFIKSQPTFPNDCFMRDVYNKAQSLLPKEEPERQIKEPIIRCNNCNQEVKPEPTKTQEEMDREKAREILNKWGLLDSEGKGNPEIVCAVLEAVGVKSGRKTKQD